METWINRVIMVCGGVAGLLLGTGQSIEATTLASATIVGVWMVRTQRWPIAKE